MAMGLRVRVIGLLAAPLAVLTLSGPDPAGAQKKGGILRIGITGEPPALDAHWTTPTLTSRPEWIRFQNVSMDR
jgi:hypothetical protein